MVTNLVKTRIDDGVMEIRLCAPQTRNSLTLELRAALGDAVEQAELDRAVRAVYLTGEGPTFCSGATCGIFRPPVNPGRFIVVSGNSRAGWYH